MTENKNFERSIYSHNDPLEINELASLNEDFSPEFIEQLQNKVSQSASGFKQKTSDDTQLFEEVNTSTETKVVDTGIFLYVKKNNNKGAVRAFNPT